MGTKKILDRRGAGIDGVGLVEWCSRKQKTFYGEEYPLLSLKGQQVDWWGLGVGRIHWEGGLHYFERIPYPLAILRNILQHCMTSN